MLLFRSEQHVDRWCVQWGRPRGGMLSLAQGWKLARLWYGDRLGPQWKPMSAQQAESVFRKVGLMGEFWTLAG
jgi:Alkylmercury lyase